MPQIRTIGGPLAPDGRKFLRVNVISNQLIPVPGEAKSMLHNEEFLAHVEPRQRNSGISVQMAEYLKLIIDDTAPVTITIDGASKALPTTSLFIMALDVAGGRFIVNVQRALVFDHPGMHALVLGRAAIELREAKLFRQENRWEGVAEC